MLLCIHMLHMHVCRCACSCLGNWLLAAWPHTSPHFKRQMMLRSVRMQRVCVHLQVYMQPSGLLSISGLASSTPFLKDFFSQYKVRPFFVAREEYKNVANQFNEVSSCAPHWHVTVRETKVGLFPRTASCPDQVDKPQGIRDFSWSSFIHLFITRRPIRRSSVLPQTFYSGLPWLGISSTM